MKVSIAYLPPLRSQRLTVSSLIVTYTRRHGGYHRSLLARHRRTHRWRLEAASIPLQFIRVRTSNPIRTCAAVRDTDGDAYNRGFMHLACGLSVGLTGLAAGYAIGVVGDTVWLIATLCCGK